MLTTATACSLVVLLGLGLDLVAGWTVVMHTYLYHCTMSLSVTLPLTMGNTVSSPSEGWDDVCIFNHKIWLPVRIKFISRA